VQFGKLTVRAAGFDVSAQLNVELVETQSNAQLPHFGSSLSDFDEHSDFDVRPNTKTQGYLSITELKLL
jgi:hypothetical protein